MTDKKTVEKLKAINTPFYYYDLNVLNNTLDKVKSEAVSINAHIHYAVKANANVRLLKIIASYGFGADCVSWNEIDAAIKAGFDPKKIVFAGVGKSDKEIENAVRAGIFCFNCESIPEMEVINQIAEKQGKTADIALRINPLVEAHTHKYITTGIEESKFGIHKHELDQVLESLKSLPKLRLIGIHFHIGSQITKMQVFQNLCVHINELQDWFSARGIDLRVINIGGGLGIDYHNPDDYPLFSEYFGLIRKMLVLKPGQVLHLEPGRALVGQCGSLISRVLYIKNGTNTKFAIIDAGMTDLIRPALYQAHHKIENLTSAEPADKYDVVGPICESSDTFARGIELPGTKRGDLLSIRSAGAYGEIMASRYNLRDLPGAVFSDEL